MLRSTASAIARISTRQQQPLSTSRNGAVLPFPSLFQQLRSIFIQTLDTPNPESLKFVPSGIKVLDQEDINGFYVTKNDPVTEIQRSPLAKSLFAVEGVKAVYLGADFVTVTKYAEHKWKLLRPQLFDVIMNWADNGKPALMDQPEITDTTILDDDDEGENRNSRNFSGVCFSSVDLTNFIVRSCGHDQRTYRGSNSAGCK